MTAEHPTSLLGSAPRRIHIHDVSMRDGLQIEPIFVPTEEKIAMLNALSRTGVSKIEATSFTSPKAIPALRDAELVLKGIERTPGVKRQAEHTSDLQSLMRNSFAVICLKNKNTKQK